MKIKSTIFTLLLIVILIIVGCSANNSLSMTGVKQVSNFPNSYSMNVDTEKYTQEVNRIINAIDKWYVHKERKNINIDILRSTYVKRANSAENKYDFSILLLELFAELKNGHSNIFTGMDEYGVPVHTSIIDNMLVITYIGENVFTNDKVEKGWIIEEIDNTPATEWVKDRFKKISGSTSQALWQEGLNWVFKRYEYEHEKRKYMMVGPKGEKLNIELSLTIPKNQLQNSQIDIEIKDFNEFGYISINTLENSIVDKFDEALKKVLDKKGIIIDLRKNDGGNSINGEQILQRIIQKETPIWQDRTLSPYDKINYSGEIIVLIGPQTFSAAESFAFNLHDSGRVTTMGEPTRGDSGGGPVLFRTEDGIYFRIPTRGLDHSASGLPMEGIGLKPHIVAKQTYEDMIHGKDTVLETAIIELTKLVDKHR